MNNYESGLENAINKTRSPDECPECGMISSSYFTNRGTRYYFCENPSCKQILFTEKVT